MQKRGGDDDGCWDGNVRRHDRGGRIYTTAMGALTLEVYYRYLPVAEENADPASQPASKTRRPDIGYLAEVTRLTITLGSRTVLRADLDASLREDLHRAHGEHGEHRGRRFNSACFLPPCPLFPLCVLCVLCA